MEIANMKTILYSVPTGYFARNLLRTGIIERLLDRKDLRIVIVTPGYDDQGFLDGIPFIPHERIFVEEMLEVDRSYDFLDRVIWKAWDLGHQYKVFQGVYNFFLNIQLWKRYYSKHHKFYARIFDKYRPDLIVGGTPGVNSRRDIPVFTEAQKRGVKTLALIHSWDNIAKRKGPLWIKPDFLGVWNEFQKQDAIEANFYRDENVILIGPAHFDVYWHNETFMERDAFFKKMGLDPDKRLITMIGTVPGLVRNNYIVDILLDALGKNKFTVPVQLVCRPTPSIEPERNEQEFGKYYAHPDIKVDLQIQHRPKLGWTPDKEQLYHFANLVKYTDVQVNIASTATLEAIILNKPVVSVAFSTVEPEKFKRLIVESIFSHHFDAVLKSGATYLANDPNELIDAINRYLLNPDLDAKKRDELRKKVLYQDDGRAAERVLQIINRLLSESAG
jgi:glycosyltransferase involved in cell wall biosynthesis